MLPLQSGPKKHHSFHIDKFTNHLSTTIPGIFCSSQRKNLSFTSSLSNMRAVIRTGEPKTLTYTTDLPEPTRAEYPEAYIVRVQTTALTREELTWEEPLTASVPVPGFDLAGTIISTPTKQDQPPRFKPGDEVYSFSIFGWQGNAKEVSVILEHELALKPKNLSWEEAASVPLSALSAYQGLFVHGKLKSPASNETQSNRGKRVLITAASGGVGTWGIQLAHLAGTEVVGTCGSSNVEFVKSLGADTVLDYRKTNLLDWVQADKESRGFDVILDCIGGQTLEDAWKCVKKGGLLISVAQPPDTKKPADGVADGVKSIYFIVEPNGSQLAEITPLIEQGTCQAVVDSVYSLEEYEKAFERLEEGHAKGKVILRLI